MNKHEFYVKSNSGFGPKEAVRIYTNAPMSDAEKKQMENLTFNEAKTLCKYRYNAQLLYGHVKE